MTFEKMEEQIALLEKTDAHLEELKAFRKKVEDDILAMNADAICEQLSGKDYGAGTATINTPNYKLKVVIGKKVTWEQGGLASIESDLVAKGQNPREYIKVKYDVSESAYKGWPESLKSMFKDARTVEPSKPKLEIEKVKA